MRVCKHLECGELIGVECLFCVEHRDSDYAFDYRKLNGHNQP